MTRKVYSALVHHPVLDKNSDIVATAVTNLDVHDIARSSLSYGMSSFLVVTPVTAQRRLVEEILKHWKPAQNRLAARGQALAKVAVVPSIEEACRFIAKREGVRPTVYATSARPVTSVPGLSYTDAKTRMDKEPSLIVFGTGHGLAPQALLATDAILPPIRLAHYNHLSVRAAAAITFDRLFGESE